MINPSTAVHGVMVCINGEGLIIRGKPGIGKSSLALELIHQGHQLVADDVVEIIVSDDKLFGHCPNMLKGILHSSELGTINIEDVFGHSALIETAPLNYIVELSEKLSTASLDLTNPSDSILGVSLPVLVLSRQNPASSLVRLYTWLKMQRLGSDDLLSKRQQIAMQQQ